MATAKEGQVNGETPNGHVNGVESASTTEVPATRLLASFVATATTKQLTPALREKVKEVVIDYIGVVVGAIGHADSTQPICNAILALQGGPLQHSDSSRTNGVATGSQRSVCTVLAHGEPHFLPQYAGLLNAALGHSMDFDDTHAAGTLHAGVTAISAALSAFEALAQHGKSPSVDEFMLAISVGYEVTCRLGRELGYDAYSRGFHNTGTAGIFGSVAAIAVLRQLSAETIEMAFGLAGSKAAGSMQYLDNGSWNKRLHPGFAVSECVLLSNSHP